MGVNRLYEPDKWKWLDSNARNRAGDYFSNIKDNNNGLSPSEFQTFLLDGRDTTSENRKEVTLFTLNNGVHAKLSYYVEIDTDTSQYFIGYRVRGTVGYYDKNDNRITELSTNSVNVYCTSQNGDSSIDKVKLFYTPSHITYDNNGAVPESGITAAGIALFGALRGHNSYVGLEPWPSLNSEIDYSDLIKYYNGAELMRLYNWSQVDQNYEIIVNAGDGKPVKPDPDDDTSKPDPGPDPDYDPGDSDPVPWPDIPDGGDALSTGFIHAYQPVAAQLQALAGKLWSDDFINTIKKIQNDPFEAIISLHSIPVSVAGANANCVVGNYDSGISMPVVSSQWTHVNLGSYYLPPYFASALDFAPYNTVDIFLPYIGVRSMQIDDVVGRNLQVVYSIDVLSGATLASIKCGDSVLYTYNCNISMEIPVTQSSYGPLYQSILNASAAVLSGYGAAGAPGAAGAAIGSAINVAISKQHSVSRGGNISGNFGCMGHFYPYLIIHRPKQSLAAGFNHFKGKPSNITTSLGSISGYTEIESIHLDGIKCTEGERDEIRALLHNGVIF